jgi:hypothetical protein
MAAHQAFFVTKDGLIFQDHTDICYTNLVYFSGELKGTDRTCKYIGHFLRDEISMIELVGMQNIYLLEHLRNSADYKYIEEYIEKVIESNIKRNAQYARNSRSKKQQKEDA